MTAPSRPDLKGAAARFGTHSGHVPSSADFKLAADALDLLAGAPDAEWFRYAARSYSGKYRAWMDRVAAFLEGGGDDGRA